MDCLVCKQIQQFVVAVVVVDVIVVFVVVDDVVLIECNENTKFHQQNRLKLRANPLIGGQ